MRDSFAHDGSVSPVLGVLQIDQVRPLLFLLLRFFSSAYLEKNDSRLTRRQPMWPGMGTEIVFELWKKNTSSSSSETYFIRVLLSGQPLETSTPLGTLDMIPWDEFEKYLNETIPEDIVGMCAQV